MKKNKYYPQENLWGKGNDLPKIKIINPNDFDVKASLHNMGFADSLIEEDMGICDPKEIKERNNLMRLLFLNPDLRQKIKSLSQSRDSLLMPKKENDFLYFYSKDGNPYWREVRDLVSRLNKVKAANPGNFPSRVESFIKNLEEDFSLEAEEAKLAKEVSARLENVAVMEGTFSIEVDKNKDTRYGAWEYIHGYKLYNSSYSAEYKAELPKWLKGRFWRMIGVAGLVQRIATYAKTEAAKHSALISSYSTHLRNDLYAGASRLIQKHFYPKDSLFLKDDSSLVLTLYFSYSYRGLEIMPISIENMVERDFSWNISNFPGSSSKQKAALQKRKGDLQRALQAAMVSAASVELYSCFPGKVFGQAFRVNSAMTDEDYRWFAIDHLYYHRLFRDAYLRISEQRSYFFDTINQLVKLSDFLAKFESWAKKLNIPICIPDISFTEHSGVCFKNLAPVSLVGKSEILVPISLDRINGEMVGLTGRHGGGKTVAGKSILESVYYALSGLPVFANSFTTDVKTVLGAVTNDEGAGSTATVFITKVKNLMEEISRVPIHESLIFIDEIGKGTQHDAGFKLGKAILIALRKGGNSVLFNTQILELAEYAEHNLGAVCYKVDKDHQFWRGISGGEIASLVKEVGLDKYLV